MKNQLVASKELDQVRSGLSVAMAKGMAQIAGGTFRMGSDVHYPEERPDAQGHGRWLLNRSVRCD
jgi:formylglycine-generating enzyme required for sulfatase activity